MDNFVEMWTASGCNLSQLGQKRVTIGRALTNDISFSDDPEVSRLHAVLEPIGEDWVIRDLNSRNGTSVNGRRISGDQPLSAGDQVTIGSARLVFRSAGEQRLAETVGAAAAPSLTRREADVLRALFRPATDMATFTEPASTREIAERLFISEAAVKQHLAHLYDKFEIHAGLDRRRTRLANEAIRRGAISLGDMRNDTR